MKIGNKNLVGNSFFALLLLGYLPAYSQTYYPLEKGNRWDYGYYSSSQQIQYSYSATITGDTVMPNEKRYAIETSPGLGTKFLRQEGAQVFQFSSSGIDSVIYDFSYAYLWGETLTVSFHGGDTLITMVNKHNGPVFDVERGIWTYYTYATNRSFYREVRIADSVGCFQIDTKDKPSLYLIGAIINGKEYGTAVTGVRNTHLVPQGFILYQNYPNPFNPTTTIRYDLPARSYVVLTVYNILGQTVETLVDEEKYCGSYEVRFDARNLPSGVYYYELTTRDNTKGMGMMLTK